MQPVSLAEPRLSYTQSPAPTANVVSPTIICWPFCGLVRSPNPPADTITELTVYVTRIPGNGKSENVVGDAQDIGDVIAAELDSGFPGLNSRLSAAAGCFGVYAMGHLARHDGVLM